MLLMIGLLVGGIALVAMYYIFYQLGAAIEKWEAAIFDDEARWT